jgi:hypothetical protein
MNRCLIIFVLVLFGIQTITFAFTPDSEVPGSIRDNIFYVESLRYSNMARLAFAEGDYVASREFSEEAIRFSILSDEYVLLRLKMRECDNAIAAAGRRLDFADSVNAAARYPLEYDIAQTAFSEARDFRAEERWDDAIEAAHRVLAALAHLGGLPGGNALPSQYTVRTWANERDALWNIAGRPWVYNDPWQWRRLYEANRDRMPERDNPDLILPGMVLDIPSIRGETRQGMWEHNRTYPSLPR